MKRFYLLFILCFFSIMPLAAQEFIVNPWGGDKVEFYVAGTDKDGKWALIYNQSHEFEEGYTFQAVDTMKNYVIFRHENQLYAAKKTEIEFSSNNPDDMVNPLSEEAQRRSSIAGDFYGSMAAAYMVLFLLAAIAIVTFVYRAIKLIILRPIVLIAIPAGILLISLIIIFGYWKFGSDIFWWCDYDRYGFFSSLFRVIPFMAVVAAQFYSIKLYEKVLFIDKEYDENGERRKLSIKPMAWSIILCLPVTLGFFLIMTFMGLHNSKLVELFAVILFFVTLGFGVWRTFKRNVATLGFFHGVFVSVFAVAYIIGCIISAFALIVLIFQLIFQILTVLGCLLVMACVVPKRTYRRSDGVIVEEY